jgi:RimJ/RimL family protein N-acetyltransferase
MPFRPEIIDDYCRWLSDPYIQQMAGEEAASPEQVIARHRAWNESADFVEYIILDREASLPIGDVSLDFSQGTPRLGIMIGESRFRGTGRAAEAVRLISEVARTMGATRLVAEIYDYNDTSLEFHRRLGFSPVRHDIEQTQWVYEKNLDSAPDVKVV